MIRFLGQLVLGNIFGIVITIGTPNAKDFGMDLSIVPKILSPAATALGKITNCTISITSCRCSQKLQYFAVAWRL